MGPIKWILIFLFVATSQVNAELVMDQGGNLDVSDSIFLGSPPPRQPPPPLAAYFLETEIFEALINENPDADEYPDPPNDYDYRDDMLLNRVPRAASPYQSSYHPMPYPTQPSYNNYQYKRDAYSSLYSRCAGPEGTLGCCKPLALCSQYYGTAVHYSYETTNYYKSCTYGYGFRGVCCPEVSYYGNPPSIINYDPRRHGGYDGRYVEIAPYAVKEAVKYAIDFHERFYRHDQHLGRDEDDPSYWGNGVVKDIYLDEVKDLGDVGAITAIATQYLTNKYGFKPASYYEGIVVSIADYLPYKYRKICTDSFSQKCYPSKYRSLDGSCNNLKYPYLGKAYSALGYIAIPRYGDNVYKPRVGVDGKPLHKIRQMRYTSLPDKDVGEKGVNMLFVQYGQLIAHDVVHVPFYQTEDGMFLDCCAGYKMGDDEVSDKCYAIALLPNDGFYKDHRRDSLDCLNFARSVIAPNYQCGLGYASKLNRQTHFHDVSLVYGISKNESDNLRVGKYGLLKFSKVGNQHYLPIDKDAECFKSSGDFCFTSGDLRTTLQPGVLVAQTIAMRLHNWCAKKLSKLNVHWDDEKLFQEARHITIAIIQHITYNEYLPLLLGWKFMVDYGILPPSHGYSYDYDPEVKPWTFHEFAGASFRLHSSIYGKVVLADEYYKPERSLPLEEFYNSGIILKNPYNFDKILRGFIMTAARKVDEYYDPAVSDLLLKNNRTFGLDLPTFNMKRGRDMGIGTYNDFRELCGLRRAYTWQDLHDVINPDVVVTLSQFYKTPEDIDLYAGGVVENHIKDSYLGPTWWCVVGHQFQTFRRADRFFYTHGGMPHSFSEAQLEEIRLMTASAVLCITTGVSSLPVFGFRTPSAGNPIVSCDDAYSLPKMSFAPWKDY